MPRELIPELHDCLKLTTLNHNFSDFDERFLKYSPKTRSWDGVLQHHCSESFLAFPTDRETFLLHMADGIAANFSRHRSSYSGEKSFVVHKLWNPNAFNKDSRLSNEYEIRELLNFYARDPSFEDLVSKYEQVLESRAEDAHPGKNVTSLLTHLILTGKFYRFFKTSSRYELRENEIIPSLGGISDLTKRKSKEWQMHLALCRLHFSQQPFRARDLNIFELLSDTKQALSHKYSDNILYQTTDELLLYYDDLSVLDSIKEDVLQKGFWISTVWAKRPLEEIKKADPLSLSGNKGENVFSISLQKDIDPPLCEICQMAHGEVIWPDAYLSKFGLDEKIKNEGVEHLCGTCFAIRSRPSRLGKMKRWTEENADVLYFKIALNYMQLMKTLEFLYKTYLKKINPDTSSDSAEVRFSLIYEFQRDYQRFLDILSNTIIHEFGKDNVETILEDMFCVKIDRSHNVFRMMELLKDLINEFFPEFLNLTDTPIKTSLSICSAKFPFFQIWREIREQSSDIQINAIGKGCIKSTYKYLDEILLATKENYRKGALFHLAEIAKLSEKLAEIRFNDKAEKADFYSYEALKRHLLPIGMDFKSILTFIKLIEA